jgi:hypothetical protein
VNNTLIVYVSQESDSVQTFAGQADMIDAGDFQNSKSAQLHRAGDHTGILPYITPQGHKRMLVSIETRLYLSKEASISDKHGIGLCYSCVSSFEI